MTCRCSEYEACGFARCCDVTVTHEGPPVVTPAPGQHVIVLDDLTPDEVRVITGLVRAMRETRADMPPSDTDIELRVARMRVADAIVMETRENAALAAWHIAHAISQMGES